MRRYVVTPCSCGCRTFTAVIGEPIRCAECGAVPAEIPAEPVNGDVSLEVVDS